MEKQGWIAGNQPFLKSTDPDQDTTSFFVFGAPLINGGATLRQLESATPYQEHREFNWSPDADLVRNTPYKLYLLASDQGDHNQSPAYQLQPWRVWVLNEKPDLNAPSDLRASLNEAGQMVLKWQDNSVQEQHFVIEISKDGETFQPLKKVAANSTEAVIESIYCEGNYTFRVKAVFALFNSGCSNIAEITSQEREPDITSLGNDLMSSLAENYRWFVNDEELIPETRRIAAYEKGFYTVELTDIFGCTSTAKTEEVITDLDRDDTTIEFYPNPVIDFIYFKQIPQQARFSIYTNQGQLIKSSIFTQKIDLSNLESGIYIINISRGDYLKSVKIIKK